MYILHSHVNQFTDMENRLSVETFNQRLNQMENTDLQLSLPKFSFGSDANLGEILPEMGLVDAFNSQAADFSPMNKRAEKQLFIQAAVHKAFITVNEEGTEAGAATGISTGVTSMPETLDVNSPFIFVIRHNETGAILFIGRVLDPKAT
jgi:serpin B